MLIKARKVYLFQKLLWLFSFALCSSNCVLYDEPPACAREAPSLVTLLLLMKEKTNPGRSLLSSQLVWGRFVRSNKVSKKLLSSVLSEWMCLEQASVASTLPSGKLLEQTHLDK